MKVWNVLMRKCSYGKTVTFFKKINFFAWSFFNRTCSLQSTFPWLQVKRLTFWYWNICFGSLQLQTFFRSFQLCYPFSLQNWKKIWKKTSKEMKKLRFIKRFSIYFIRWSVQWHFIESYVNNRFNWHTREYLISYCSIFYVTGGSHFRSSI